MQVDVFRFGDKSQVLLQSNFFSIVERLIHERLAIHSSVLLLELGFFSLLLILCFLLRVELCNRRREAALSSRCVVCGGKKPIPW